MSEIRINKITPDTRLIDDLREVSRRRNKDRISVTKAILSQRDLDVMENKGASQQLVMAAVAGIEIRDVS